MKELIKVDESGTGFELDGHKYTFRLEMSLDRFLELNYVQPEIAFGVDVKSIYNNNKRIVEYLNTGKMAQAGKIALDMNEAFDKYLKSKPRSNTLMKLATFFLIRDDEDATTYSEEFANEKIKEWVEGGLEYSSFFTLLANAMMDFIAHSSGISQTISEGVEKVIGTAGQ